MNANTPSANLQHELLDNVYARMPDTFLFGKNSDGRLICLHPRYNVLDVLQFYLVTDHGEWTEQDFPYAILVRSSDCNQEPAFCLFEPAGTRIIGDSVSTVDDISKVQLMHCLALIVSPKNKNSNGLHPIWSFKAYWNGKNMAAFLSPNPNHTALVQIELQNIAAAVKEPGYVNATIAPSL